MYKKLFQFNGIIKDDNIFIPNDTENRYWREYLKWLDLGNSPIDDNLAVHKQTKIQGINQHVKSLLNSVHAKWLLTSNPDTTPPVEIKTLLDNVRTARNNAITAINNCVSYNDLQNVVITWPDVDN